MNLLNFCILYSILYCCLNYAFYAVDLNILNAMANSVEPNQSDLVFTVLYAGLSETLVYKILGNLLYM